MSPKAQSNKRRRERKRMIYKQRGKNSRFYFDISEVTGICKSQEEWMAMDDEAEFIAWDAKTQDTGTPSKALSNSNNVRGGVLGGERGNYTQKRDKRDKFVPEGVTTFDNRDRCDNRDSVTDLATLASEWFKNATGRFTTEQFDNELGIKTPDAKANRRQIFHRAKQDGLIRKDKAYNNVWYMVEEELETLDPFTDGQAKPLPLKWAFGIEDYVDLYEGDLIVIAGSKDAGKTAFLLDFLYRNKDNVECWYFSSELGSERLKIRLENFECDLDGWKVVNFKRRKACLHWAEIMRPNAYNLVDFLEIHKEFYQIAEPLADIHAVLKKGIAIVALQKNKGADEGHGSAFTTEKASLAIALDNGKLKIVSGKTWRQRNVNPKGLTATFKLIKGCQFMQILPLGHHTPEELGEEKKY